MLYAVKELVPFGFCIPSRIFLTRTMIQSAKNDFEILAGNELSFSTHQVCGIGVRRTVYGEPTAINMYDHFKSKD